VSTKPGEDHHVSLSVKDIEKSIDFYMSFGFKKCSHWIADDQNTHIAHLQLGDYFLELFWFKNHQPASTSTHALETDLPTIGIKHFGLKVASIEEAKNELQKKGFANNIEIKHGRTGIDYFFIKDPSGIFVEIVQDARDFN
jgi:glyoxylase I family protein